VHRPLPRPSRLTFDEHPNLASRPSLAFLDKKEEEEEEDASFDLSAFDYNTDDEAASMNLIGALARAFEFGAHCGQRLPTVHSTGLIMEMWPRARRKRFHLRNSR